MASGFNLAFFLCLMCGLLIAESLSVRPSPWSLPTRKPPRLSKLPPIFPWPRPRACPLGWTQFGSRCYIFRNARVSMAAAELSCIRSGGNLASIHSFSEHNFIRRLIFKACRTHVPSWIGLHDAVQERTWLWTDGSKFNYRCWAFREPNNLRGREDCVEINGNRGYWNDRPCYYRRPYVCVRKRLFYIRRPYDNWLKTAVA